MVHGYSSFLRITAKLESKHQTDNVMTEPDWAFVLANGMSSDHLWHCVTLANSCGLQMDSFTQLTSGVRRNGPVRLE